MPHWMQVAARFNPVDWGVGLARGRAAGHDWSPSGCTSGTCSRCVVVTAAFANWAFRVYQRSL